MASQAYKQDIHAKPQKKAPTVIPENSLKLAGRNTNTYMLTDSSQSQGTRRMLSAALESCPKHTFP